VSDIDHFATCIKFKKKFGDWLVDSVERSLGKNFDDALTNEPSVVLDRIIRAVHQRYIVPFEMVHDIDKNLMKYHIHNWKFAFSESEELSLKPHLSEIQEFIDSFYKVANTLHIDLKQKGLEG
jgi:hypothetical protein